MVPARVGFRDLSVPQVLAYPLAVALRRVAMPSAACLYMAHDIASAEPPCHLAAQHLDGSIGMSQGVARRLCRPTALQPLGREVTASGALFQGRFARNNPEHPPT